MIESHFHCAHLKRLTPERWPGTEPYSRFRVTIRHRRPRLRFSDKVLLVLGGLWHNTSADIAHDASCGHIMPYPRGETGRAMSNPTLHTPKGPSSKPPTRQRRRQRRQPDGAEERSRPANVCSVRRSARAATAVLGANIPRARRSGDARVHARRVRLRGAHPRRTDAAPSGDLRCARNIQPDESPIRQRI